MLSPLQDILQFCRIIFICGVVFLAIEEEEIVVKDDADALKQAGVNAFALEDIIHIGAVAVQLLCEPTNAALLAQQFCLDFFTDVYCHFFTFIL